MNIQIPERLDFRTDLCPEIKWSLTILFLVQYSNGQPSFLNNLKTGPEIQPSSDFNLRSETRLFVLFSGREKKMASKNTNPNSQE